MNQEFKEIRMTGLDRTRCGEVDFYKDDFDTEDEFEFTINLSGEVTRIWEDAFREAISLLAKDLVMKTNILDNQIQLYEVPFSSFKNTVEIYKKCIEIANLKTNENSKRREPKIAKINKSLDDLDADVFNNKPVEPRFTVF